jgi:hypothetical protein
MRRKVRAVLSIFNDVAPPDRVHNAAAAQDRKSVV